VLRPSVLILMQRTLLNHNAPLFFGMDVRPFGYPCDSLAPRARFVSKMDELLCAYGSDEEEAVGSPPSPGMCGSSTQSCERASEEADLSEGGDAGWQAKERDERNPTNVQKTRDNWQQRRVFQRHSSAGASAPSSI
jgi:hypothetical protein